jgi:hypothetical protein
MSEPKFVDDVIRELVREEIRAELERVAVARPHATSYVTIPEYAKARCISVSTVRNAIRKGHLPAMKFGAAVRVRSDVEIGASVVPVVPSPGPSPAKRAEELFQRKHAHQAQSSSNVW